MRILHCADLHLDSKMRSNLDADKAKERRFEILETYEKMVRYAAEHDVDAILIAGDLFDTSTISAKTKNAVLHAITSNPEIDFYYLKGNHDHDNFLSDVEDIPENLHMFDDTWTRYALADDKVMIHGIELTSANSREAYVSLVLDPNKFNIVMLHGQEAESSSKDKTEIVNLGALKNKGIDYLALGHIHQYKREKLDPRAIYCYSGCLEGRGFDETGEHGFVVLDIDTESGQFRDSFVAFAGRRIYEISVDVTGCTNTSEMIDKAQACVEEAKVDATSLVKFILTGAVDVECEKDVDFFYNHFKNDYYFLKVYDETRLHFSAEDYRYDKSLKGEFVRQVLADESIDEDEKTILLRYGLQLIEGEEVR